MKIKKSKRQKQRDNPLSGYWMRQADKEFGRIFHSRQWSCLICGKGTVQMAHLIPRENYLYRWDMENVIPLCGCHHRLSTKISYHNAPLAFMAWMRKNYPERLDWVEEHKEIITRKAELPWTFREKYEELQKL